MRAGDLDRDGRLIWAVAGGLASEPLVGALERHGLDTIYFDDLDVDVPAGRDLSAIVLRVDGRDPVCTAVAVCHLRLNHPGCRLFVVMDASDAVAASVVLRYGGHPLPFDEVERIERWICPAPLNRGWILDVLAAAVHGKLVDAMAELSLAGRRPSAALATEQLAQVASALLDRLAHRSQYAIPVRLVTERFAPGASIDEAACLDMLQWAVSRHHMLDVGSDELLRRHGATGALFGAFHVAYGLVRFASERWWRPATSVLDDLSWSSQAPSCGRGSGWAARCSAPAGGQHPG